MENVQVYVALAIIGVTIILFATEAFKTSITAILSSLAMVLVGINTPKNLTSGFSNSAMLFCFGIAVVGTALSETGCLSYLSKRIMFISRFAPVENLITVIAVGILFVIRKYLYISHLDKRKKKKDIEENVRRRAYSPYSRSGKSG